MIPPLPRKTQPGERPYPKLVHDPNFALRRKGNTLISSGTTNRQTDPFCRFTERDDEAHRTAQLEPKDHRTVAPM
jgi:hypothetical protein